MSEQRKIYGRMHGCRDRRFYYYLEHVFDTSKAKISFKHIKAGAINYPPKLKSMNTMKSIKIVAAVIFAIALSACNGDRGKSGSEASANHDAHASQVRQDDSVAGSPVSTPVAIDFYADWCGPCRQISPLFDQLADKYGDRIEFKRVNIDEDGQLAAQYGITSIPTFIFLDAEGNVVNKIVGADHESLTSAVKKLYEANNL